MPSISAFDTNRRRTNATARLSTILDKLNANSAAVPVADVLAAAFSIQDPDPNRTFLLAYTSITTLLERSQREVETYLSTELAFYGVHFAPLRACFNPKNSSAQWNTYKAHLSPNEVTGIRHTAQRLKSLVPEYEASDAEFKDIIASIDQMYEALDSEELSSESREALRSCLDEIKRAVDEYKIWGASGLRQAYTVFVGTVATSTSIQEDLRKDKERKGGLCEKIGRIGAGLVLLLTILQGAHAVEQDYLPALERFILPEPADPGPMINPAPSLREPSDGSIRRTREVHL